MDKKIAVAFVGIGMWLTYALLFIAFWVFVAYAVIHFVLKHW